MTPSLGLAAGSGLTGLDTGAVPIRTTARPEEVVAMEVLGRHPSPTASREAQFGAGAHVGTSGV